jgi:hypothetical protein
MNTEYPKYVRLVNGSVALRLTDIEEYHTAVYTRDAGAWFLKAKIVNGKVIISQGLHMECFLNEELIAVTREYWLSDSGKYVNSLRTVEELAAQDKYESNA